MKRTFTTTTTRTIIVLATLVMPWLVPALSLAATPMTRPTLSSASNQGLDQIATDSVEDTLKACLSRIPKDASEGQRFLAVDSCKQQEAVRNNSRINF